MKEPHSPPIDSPDILAVDGANPCTCPRCHWRRVYVVRWRAFLDAFAKRHDVVLEERLRDATEAKLYRRHLDTLPAPDGCTMITCWCGITVRPGRKHYPNDDPEDGAAHLPVAPVICPTCKVDVAPFHIEDNGSCEMCNDPTNDLPLDEASKLALEEEEAAQAAAEEECEAGRHSYDVAIGGCHWCSIHMEGGK